MRNKKVKYSPVSRIFNLLFIALFFIGTVCSLLSACISSSVLSEDFITDSLTKPKYIDMLKQEIDYQLKLECVKAGLDGEVVSSAVTYEKVRAVTYQYARSLYKKLNGGDPLITVAYPRDEIAKVIDEVYGKSDSKNYKSEAERDLITSAVSKKITDQLNVFVNEKVLNTVAAHIGKNSKLARFASLKWIFAAITALCAAVVLLVTRKTAAGAFYALSGAGFLASALCFVPVRVLLKFNLGSKLAIGTSTLKFFITQLLDSVLGKISQITLISLICFSLLLLISAAVYAFGKSNKKKAVNNESAESFSGDLPDDAIDIQ